MKLAALHQFQANLNVIGLNLNLPITVGSGACMMWQRRCKNLAQRNACACVLFVVYYLISCRQALACLSCLQDVLSRMPLRTVTHMTIFTTVSVFAVDNLYGTVLAVASHPTLELQEVQAPL